MGRDHVRAVGHEGAARRDHDDRPPRLSGDLEVITVGTDARIDWSASNDRAEARLNGGNAAEVVLRRFPGMTPDPVTIANLRYFGAPRNKGFILMPNEIDAYRVGPKPFEYKGTNGFMITYDITSKDVKS